MRRAARDNRWWFWILMFIASSHDQIAIDGYENQQKKLSRHKASTYKRTKEWKKLCTFGICTNCFERLNVKDAFIIWLASFSFHFSWKEFDLINACLWNIVKCTRDNNNNNGKMPEKYLKTSQSQNDNDNDLYGGFSVSLFSCVSCMTLFACWSVNETWII